MRRMLIIDARIDLHGYTQDQAYNSLLSFLSSACKVKKKHVLVVTGKGNIDKPSIIKTAVPRWFEYTELKQYVASYAEAPINLGGSGAMIVKLKSII